MATYDLSQLGFTSVNALDMQSINFAESSQGTISMRESDIYSPESSVSARNSEAPEEKKPVKKRKSWGQELPTPKTSLPPR